MSGTVAGGKKSAAKNLAKDPAFYRKIAFKAQAAWDRNGRAPRGFSVMPKDLVSEAGRKGGRISRRRSAAAKQKADKAA